MPQFFSTPLFTWVVLPLLIILARICDVSLDTIRIIFVINGKKVIAPILGFFESLIWLLAITQIMQHLSNPVCYVAYAFGFGLGTYIGMKIEEKLAIGYAIIRVITKTPGDELVHNLQQQNYRTTKVKAEGKTGEVDIIFSIIRRSDINHYINTVKKFNPSAFYTIESVRAISNNLGSVSKMMYYPKKSVHNLNP
ncbi:MAG TPA: DUF2179 domain-containing protein [Balneolales bacterium]|nr:DUF2179 domain-containing protein [Balneolales bacterium]